MVKHSLYRFGLKLFYEKKLKESRIIGSFLEEKWFEELLENQNQIIKWINKNIFFIRAFIEKNNKIDWNINKDSFEIVIREHKAPEDKYEMDWHLDNCSIVKQSKEFAQKNKLFSLTLLEEGSCNYNTYLYTGNIPKYTLIIYLTDECEGGELCFIDKEIKPQKGLFVLFSGYDLHCVKPLIRGHRIAIVIKIYSKN